MYIQTRDSIADFAFKQLTANLDELVELPYRVLNLIEAVENGVNIFKKNNRLFHTSRVKLLTLKTINNL